MDNMGKVHASLFSGFGAADLTENKVEAVSNTSEIRHCGDCDAFCECGLGGKDAAKPDDIACEYFDDTCLSQMKQTGKQI